MKSQIARSLLWVAAGLLIMHGVLELLPLFLLVNSAPLGPPLIFDELARNWPLTEAVGVVMELLRISAAAGILANREWGWVLGLLVSAITFAMLTFYLPDGVADALFAGGALMALVIGHYPQARIIES